MKKICVHIRTFLTWLKPYMHMNTELSKNVKNYFEKKFLKLMNNADFAETVENVQKLKYIMVVTTESRRNYFVSELNYHMTMFLGKRISNRNFN